MEDNGLVALGGELTTETLTQAYRSGIFPWPTPGMPILGFVRPSAASSSSPTYTFQRVYKKPPAQNPTNLRLISHLKK